MNRTCGFAWLNDILLLSLRVYWVLLPSFFDHNGCMLNYFQRTLNIYCYTSCILTNIYIHYNIYVLHIIVILFVYNRNDNLIQLKCSNWFLFCSFFYSSLLLLLENSETFFTFLMLTNTWCQLSQFKGFINQFHSYSPSNNHHYDIFLFSLPVWGWWRKP